MGRRSLWFPERAGKKRGLWSGRRWLYVGPAGRDIWPGDRVCFGTLRLVAQEAEAVYFRGEVLYHRAVLRQEKEAAE